MWWPLGCIVGCWRKLNMVNQLKTSPDFGSPDLRSTGRVSGLVGSGLHHGSGLCFVQLSSPFGEIAPPNSPFRPSTATPAVGLVYAPAYIKSNARGRGWRPAVGLAGAISARGDDNWPEHFRGAAGAFCHCISTAPPPPTSGVWPMMPIRGGLVV